MPSARSQEMLVQAATLYYIDGLSQAEVASAIGVSRSNVSRVLAEARTAGIVSIRINNPLGRADDLEAQLRERFSLADCRVARAESADAPLAQVGRLGAAWLESNLPTDGRIALSWGSSVQAVVDAVGTDHQLPNVEVLPLVGGLSSVDQASDGNVLVGELADRIGARHRRLHAPAVVDSPALRDALLAERSIRDVLADAATSTIAVVGIGTVGHGASKRIVDTMALEAPDRAAFDESGAVGDCCTRFYDAEGEPLETPADARVLAIDLDALRGIPTIVGVAAGVAKTPGVLAALRGGLLQVLVVDAELARALLAA